MLDKIVSIERVNSESKRYDITVGLHNNFFANGILIHNCQNLTSKIKEAQGEEFEVTYKLDGSSFTAYVFRYNGEDDGIFTGVCSRNLELKIDESNEGNTFVKTFIENDLDAKLRQYHAETDKFIAIQGEMVGPGIQDNFEGLDKVELYVYSVFDIREQRYMLPNEARTAVKFMGLNYVPVFAERVTLTSLQDILTMADGECGLKGTFREGLVFKSLTRDFSFKAISNRYLLKTGR